MAAAEASAGGTPRVAAAERGSTTVADRVVAKIAAQAAREALGGVPPDSAAPHAMVAVHHDTAHVRVTLELDYPSDIGARCAAVRRRVTERVTTLAGMEVPEVAVQVERLHSVHTRRGAKERLR
ncbi:Asp23/Gls24 family envelope stress response protein [Streptomyces genisteinicus]|uniref:Asp23/Gls24 family envelope stress response protein n=1 Tax=Streptomyces genisteinicus TaxID=2768068 RepID=A0A7H0HQ45_9ACTN|nr:Asp23/Gls24 family envelope stress response protein [Streptomyces genisteinicus]QNP62661.1 Asp23/Gls24 family envelope stress response protein [Streptomyces genisteinicus]